MLPRAVRRESVLCLGRMSVQWRGLALGPNEQVAEHAEVAAAAAAATSAREEAEAYAGDKSSGESGDEDGADSSMVCWRATPPRHAERHSAPRGRFRQRR
eukprot:1883798-Prymnesium_polylepis.1